MCCPSAFKPEVGPSVVSETGEPASPRAAVAEIKIIDVPKIELSLPTYYVLSTAEATSNLGRFDGVKYTERKSTSTDINSLYIESRTSGFGDEVKRRIMLGNYVLSSGYIDAYYGKAKKVQQYLANSFNKAFENCDAIIIPTTFGEAFKIGEKTQDPVSMYLEDTFTVVANISGIPAMSVPYGKGENGLPLGLQILALCGRLNAYRRLYAEKTRHRRKCFRRKKE